MRQPSVYTPYEMQNWPTFEEFAPGVYRASRPINFMWSFRRSLHVAWKVFRGDWDALRWNGSQGYERPKPSTPAEQPADFDGWGKYWASLDKDSQEKLTNSGGISAARAWFVIGAAWGRRDDIAVENAEKQS